MEQNYGELASRAFRERVFANRPKNVQALAEHEAKVAYDLTCLNFPPANWVPSRAGVVDVLVVGAGMCGQTAAYALLKEGLRNIRVVDRAPMAEEGPWGTFARMEILRSPKHLTGPDLGVPSLTFRAWYEASYGLSAWEQLHKVYRLDWLEYLIWVRQRVGVAVENWVAVESVVPAEGLLRIELKHLQTSRTETVLARKVVLAMGREGSGDVRLPSFLSLDSKTARTSGRVHHSMDAIDFAALKGKRVGVLGAGASAFDNAACALEAGAAVTLFCRRPELPQVNKSKWTAFAGFFKGFASLPDKDRWRIYTYIFDEQIPPPYESVLRCDRHENFQLVLGQTWRDVKLLADSVQIDVGDHHLEFDAVIFGTGFDVNLQDRRELALFAPHILSWADRIGNVANGKLEATDSRIEAGRFPYLADGFSLRARTAAAPPELGSLYLFNWGATISQGAVAGDIPGLAHGATKLAGAIAKDIFFEDAVSLETQLVNLSEPELKLTRFYVPKP